MDERKLAELNKTLETQVNLICTLLESMREFSPSIALERQRDQLLESVCNTLIDLNKTTIAGFKYYMLGEEELKEDNIQIEFMKLDDDFQEE